MTAEEAKRILQLYRGTARDREDPDIRAALDVAESNPELKRWVNDQVKSHAVIRDKLRQVKAPTGLKDAVLARRKIVPAPVWWRQPIWAAAAALVLLSALAVVLFRPAATHDRFAQYQSRMVGTALRQYRMDIVTNDMQQVRQFLAARGAPADYELPEGLRALSLTGGGALKWRSNPVSMVCFDRGDQQMLFLFVTDTAALKDPPPAQPRIAQVNDVVVASWTRGQKTYLLAGPADPDFAKKYL